MHGHIRRRHKPECTKRRDKSKRCNCDGSWQARYPDPSQFGKRIERTFRTKLEAEEWLVSEAASQQQGTWSDPRQSERPFRDVIEAWQEGWHRLSPTTRARYNGVVNNYLLPEFGAMPIARITHEAVQRYVNRLSADGQSAANVHNIYKALRKAMNTGVRMRMVKVSPCTNVDLPRPPRSEMLFLTAEEVRALAEKIDPYYRTLIYTASYTGLRAGELHALRRGDLELLRGVLHVRRSLREVGGHQSFGPTKTQETRTVSLPKFLREMLAAHLATLPPGTPEALVFPSKEGKPLRHSLFYARHFKPAVRGKPARKGRPAVLSALPASKAGLRFHDLRHTCASLAVAAGAHPKLVQEMLGHSSITVTLDRYSHLFPSAHESLAEQLDATFIAAESSPVAASNVVGIR
jgi:integrase